MSFIYIATGFVVGVAALALLLMWVNAEDLASRKRSIKH
ncbi:hypothetical protein SAMN05444171_7879 [Bradyrhizobium lablabi]|uniref:Uncharacterized protein n=1 Tax=Bradyrhizobium lablabi TaxID=722472 RepID=A0A1H5JGI0_9BRAD|nr:hypothetical protein SAMN05444171_7812 [Bradyrhizobium lablabi]SEE53071.1 hypothetical protein SAMN05444171_7879 [Bradyrhizobium lablabi]